MIYWKLKVDGWMDGLSRRNKGFFKAKSGMPPNIKLFFTKKIEKVSCLSLSLSHLVDIYARAPLDSSSGFVLKETLVQLPKYLCLNRTCNLHYFHPPPSLHLSELSCTPGAIKRERLPSPPQDNKVGDFICWQKILEMVDILQHDANYCIVKGFFCL